MIRQRLSKPDFGVLYLLLYKRINSPSEQGGITYMFDNDLYMQVHQKLNSEIWNKQWRLLIGLPKSSYI